MFTFLKRTQSHASEPKKSWFNRLTGQFSRLFLGKKVIDAALFEELETSLLLADVGMATTQKILDHLTKHVERHQLHDIDALLNALKNQLVLLLKPCEEPIILNKQPFVLLMIGVNGAGKTTSIAKIAHFYHEQNKRVMLAAGDTFRAAATEQLQVWGDRNHVPVIAQHAGADSASVIYDAITSAKAKHMDLLIADTAGRLHTQTHLMEELKKVKRVIAKLDPSAPHEVMLVIDASAGQNALQQAKQFHEAIGITGLAITKLDGTAKGGIIFAIADQLKLPIRFIGIGEHIDDLKPFHAEEFVEVLFS